MLQLLANHTYFSQQTINIDFDSFIHLSGKLKDCFMLSTRTLKKHNMQGVIWKGLWESEMEMCMSHVCIYTGIFDVWI